MSNIKEKEPQKFSLSFSVKTTGDDDEWFQCNFSARDIYWEYKDGFRHIKIKGKGEKTYYEKNSGTTKNAIEELDLEPVLAIGDGGTQFECILSPPLSLKQQDVSQDVPGYTYINNGSNMFVERNMFLEFSEEAINKNIASKILPYNYNDDGKKFSTIKPSEVFSIVNDRDKGDPEKKLRVALDQVPSGTQSIRYWYFDFDSAYQRDYTNSTSYYKSTPDCSGYHFVFGVNVTEADFKRGYIDIYITKTTNRDERVYDSVGRQVGIVHNCIDSNGNYEPPKYQTFDPTNITQFEKITFRNEIGVKGWVSTTGEHYYTLGENVYAYIYPTETALDINGDLAWKIYDSAGTLLKTYESGGNNSYFKIDFMFDGKAAVAIACVIPKET